MHLLLFSDLHCDKAAAQNIIKMSRNADIVIGAGDFATTRQGLQEIIEMLAVIDRPTLLVPGNTESYDELADACKVWPAAKVLHCSGAEIAGIKFWGVGGGIPITFGPPSYEFSEDEGHRLLTNCPQGAILIAHSPPKGFLDEAPNGKSVGSLAVFEAVKRCQPLLVVCGHIHNCAGRSEMIASTYVANAGPRGILWNVPRNFKGD